MEIEKETIRCNFCGSSKFTKYDQIGEWTIVKCKECGFCYTNPAPIDLERLYDEDYYKDYRHKSKYYNQDGTIKKEIGDYSNNALLIENYLENRGSLLEIGAARGNFLKTINERGWKVDGVEISNDAVKLAKDLYDLDLFCGSFEDYTSNKKFDVICMYQTLEHLPNPKQVLEKSYKLLKNNGIIVVEVPNINSFDLKINKQRKINSYDLPRHLSHFSPLFLKKELRKTGFEILDTDLYYSNFILKIMKWLQRRKQNDNTLVSQEKTTIQELPMMRINKPWKVKLLDMISIIFPGWRFTIIARKTK